jgi:hypothetical protein
MNMADEIRRHDGVQHGIDDDPTSDAEKGATLGGIGGAVTGAIAGAAAGPGGAVIGAVIGGVAGAVASGAAVGAIDRVDNDNTVSGVGHGVTRDADYVDVDAPGNGVPGVQTGGYAVDGTPDTRGILEKTADTVTGDNIDDKTGRAVSYDTNQDRNWVGTDPLAPVGTPTDRAYSGSAPVRDASDFQNAHNGPSWGNNQPGIQTGGHAVDGTPDTRGVLEKSADAVTGDNIDDKTGKRVS